MLLNENLNKLPVFLGHLNNDFRMFGMRFTHCRTGFARNRSLFVHGKNRVRWIVLIDWIVVSHLVVGFGVFGYTEGSIAIHQFETSVVAA